MNIFFNFFFFPQKEEGNSTHIAAYLQANTCQLSNQMLAKEL
jgi:hypothetical protein